MAVWGCHAAAMVRQEDGRSAEPPRALWPPGHSSRFSGLSELRGAPDSRIGLTTPRCPQTSELCDHRIVWRMLLTLAAFRVLPGFQNISSFVRGPVPTSCLKPSPTHLRQK